MIQFLFSFERRFSSSGPQHTVRGGQGQKQPPEFLKEQNQKLGVDVPEIAEKKTFNDALSIEEFTALSSVEDKLVEIYKLLLSERGLL